MRKSANRLSQWIFCMEVQSVPPCQSSDRIRNLRISQGLSTTVQAEVIYKFLRSYYRRIKATRDSPHSIEWRVSVLFKNAEWLADGLSMKNLVYWRQIIEMGANHFLTFLMPNLVENQEARAVERRVIPEFLPEFPRMGQNLGRMWVKVLGGFRTPSSLKTAVLKQRIAGVKSDLLKQERRSPASATVSRCVRFRKRSNMEHREQKNRAVWRPLGRWFMGDGRN